MPWFHCFVRGENFPAVLMDSDRSMGGFFVNLFVEAADPGEAEQLALAELRNEPKLALPAGVQRPKNAKVIFESINEVDAADVPQTRPGFVWFLEGDD